jgi:hypothetical protein
MKTCTLCGRVGDHTAKDCPMRENFPLRWVVMFAILVIHLRSFMLLL